MAEEEVVAPQEAVVDHKRKLEDIETEEAGQNGSTEPDSVNNDGNVAEADGSEAKRPRLDDENDEADASANSNGLKEEKTDEAVKKEENEEPTEHTIEEVKETVEVKIEQHSSVDGHVSGETQEISVKEETKEVLTISKEETEEAPSASKEETVKEDSVKEDVTVKPPGEEPQQEIETPKQDTSSVDESQTTSRRMEVPNNKVGVLIGKAGDTIRYLQYNSGAKIQIMRDADADPNAPTRPVELVGTISSINKAEKLITAVIAEADAGGSPSLVARGLPTASASGAAEQVEIKVPNEKVGLIIGRGGETIKSLQTRSGARIQLIPQHLPEGDGSKERIVRVTGDMRQIEVAQEMIKEVMSQNVRPSPLSGGYNQQAYRPRGPSGPPQWGPRGPHSAQLMGYDYHQRGPYPPQNPQYPPPTYGGGYPPQQGPRSNFGGPPQGGASYDYYGGQGGHLSASHSTPNPGHVPGPSPAPAMGPPQSHANYNYGQSHGPGYGHQPQFAQSAPQQNYGHGYDEPKYDHHALMQHPYGGHGNPQPGYPQGSSQPGYPQQQQYGKPPSYGMPAHGPTPQSYGPPRAAQPGDMPYQTPAPSAAPSYGSNVPQQQPYPYAASGAMQQSYPPYGSAPATDGYNQPTPVSAQGYAQSGGQTVPSYSQPVGQQGPAYGQVAPTGGYAPYTNAQQGYAEQQQQQPPAQQPAPTSTGYGYQAPQDPNYASGATAAYVAPPSGQAGYAQPAAVAATAQPSYDQSAPQAAAYGVAPGNAAPATYGKNVSPQPTSYPQYDSTQMYAAPR